MIKTECPDVFQVQTMLEMNNTTNNTFNNVTSSKILKPLKAKQVNLAFKTEVNQFFKLTRTQTQQFHILFKVNNISVLFPCSNYPKLSKVISVSVCVAFPPASTPQTYNHNAYILVSLHYLPYITLPLTLQSKKGTQPNALQLPFCIQKGKSIQFLLDKPNGIAL